jgi:hypothetical protein
MKRAANIFARQIASHAHILSASRRECHAHYAREGGTVTRLT